jgi:hypothetical protein
MTQPLSSCVLCGLVLRSGPAGHAAQRSQGIGTESGTSQGAVQYTTVLDSGYAAIFGQTAQKRQQLPVSKSRMLFHARSMQVWTVGCTRCLQEGYEDDSCLFAVCVVLIQ